MNEKLPSSIPVRLTLAQRRGLAEMKKSTGLNRAILLRLSTHYFLQQAKNGKLDPLELFREVNAKAA